MPEVRDHGSGLSSGLAQSPNDQALLRIQMLIGPKSVLGASVYRIIRKLLSFVAYNIHSQTITEAVPPGQPSCSRHALYSLRDILGQKVI